MIVRFSNFIFTVILNTDVYFEQKLQKAYLPASILAPTMLDSKRVSLANEEEMSYRQDIPFGNQFSQQFGFDVISIQHTLIMVISVNSIFLSVVEIFVQSMKGLSAHLLCQRVTRPIYATYCKMSVSVTHILKIVCQFLYSLISKRFLLFRYKSDKLGQQAGCCKTNQP